MHYMYILINKCWITCNFPLYYKELFSTPKNDRRLVVRVVCSTFSDWSYIIFMFHFKNNRHLLLNNGIDKNNYLNNG